MDPRVELNSIHVVDPLACSEAKEHLGIFSGALWRQPSADFRQSPGYKKGAE
jgi:hypothetical protein